MKTNNTTVFTGAKWHAWFDPVKGKYYKFSPEKIVVAKPWPPQAWCKKKGSAHWQHTRMVDLWVDDIELIPDLDYANFIFLYNKHKDISLFPFFMTEYESRAAFAAYRKYLWMQSIPLEARKAVINFLRQWHLLSMIARCGDAAIDLIYSNPALAWMMASNWIFHKPPVAQPMRAVRSLLKKGKKQKEMLEWLGFPGTESIRKILRKTSYKAIDWNNLLILRRHINDRYTHKILSHLPTLTDGIFFFINNPRMVRCISFPLLETIVTTQDEEKEQISITRTFYDAFRMCRLLGINEQRLRHIKRVATLIEFHDDLARKLNKVKMGEGNIKFPPPPLAGTECIIPLETSLDLVKEGYEQKNCIASYIEFIADNSHHGRMFYAYKTIPPLERCTLMIENCGRGWKLREIKKTCNQPASKYTLAVVQEWLKGGNKVLKSKNATK